MRLRFSLAGLVLFLMSTMAWADWHCDICGHSETNGLFTTYDQMDGSKRFVCPDCHVFEKKGQVCFLCNLPVREGFETLPDGRLICARDAKLIVESEDDAKHVCLEARDDLDRFLARYMNFPSTNILLSVVNRFYLENLFHAPGQGQSCVSVYGATASNPVANNSLVHSVCILSHLPKARFMAVSAHEYTHAWMNENVPPQRKQTLDKDTMEAFCELVAYKFMESRQETRQMEIIQKNNYTKGKIDVLLAADARFGFNAVLEWIKDGDDATFDLDTVEKVRAVHGTYVSPSSVTLASYAIPEAARATPEPTTLVLKSISGTQQRRFALINGTTFETMEKGRVRIGQTNLVVRCLEIAKDSVTIQVDGSPEKKQLFLRSE